MKSVVIKRAELLEKLKQNKKEHVIIYEEALEKRICAVHDYLEAMGRWMDENPGKQPTLEQHFPMPESNEDNYDRAIEMLEMDTRDEIELDQHEFDQLVRDKWPQTQALMRTAIGYGVKAAMK